MTTLTFSGVGKAMDAVPSLALSARVARMPRRRR